MGRRAVVIGPRRLPPLPLLPVATGAVELQRSSTREGSSRESSAPFLAVAAAAARGTAMDAHEDYVWPRATSELILLPVTGLECVGERLLAGELWFEARASGEETERSPGEGPQEQRDAPSRRRTGGGREPTAWRG